MKVRLVFDYSSLVDILCEAIEKPNASNILSPIGARVVDDEGEEVYGARKFYSSYCGCDSPSINVEIPAEVTEDSWYNISIPTTSNVSLIKTALKTGFQSLGIEIEDNEECHFIRVSAIKKVIRKVKADLLDYITIPNLNDIIISYYDYDYHPFKVKELGKDLLINID